MNYANKIFYVFFMSFLVIGCEKDTKLPNEVANLTLTDVDGNNYNTITVGNQIWMLENLKTTKFNDGTPIAQFSFGLDWHNANNAIAYYQWANTSDLNKVHDKELPFDYYGAMYNHYAIESGKLAPKGWRIPSRADFIELETYLASAGYQGNEATVLKTKTGWLSSSGNGTNSIGFNGLPNGYVSTPGTPTFSEGIATWATTNLNANNRTRILIQLYDQNKILMTENAIQIGAGIRCIKEKD